MAALPNGRRQGLVSSQCNSLAQVAHSQSSTDAIDALAAGTLILSGAQLRDFGLPLPPLPPESAIVVGMRAVP